MDPRPNVRLTFTSSVALVSELPFPSQRLLLYKEGLPLQGAA